MTAARDSGAIHRTLTLPPDAASPRTARRFLVDSLRGRVDEDRIDTALLLVTELVTNVVVHAGTDATVEVNLDDPTVVVRVSDRHPAPIGVRPPSPARGPSVLVPEVEAVEAVAPAAPVPAGPAHPAELGSAGVGVDAELESFADLDALIAEFGEAAAEPDRVAAAGASPATAAPEALAGPDVNELREDGRGLALVDALSTSWGTEHRRSGKTVWFSLVGVGALGREPAAGPAAASEAATIPGPAGPGTASPGATSPGATSPGGGSGLDGTRAPDDGPPPAELAPLTTGSARSADPVGAGAGRTPRLLARELVSAVSAEEEVGELLAQLLDALPFAAGAVRRPASAAGGPAVIAELGRPGPAHEARVVPLEAREGRVGDLLLWGGGGDGGASRSGREGRRAAGEWPDADEWVTVVARWMALALSGADLRRAEERRIGMLSFIAEASDLLAGSLNIDRSLSLLAHLPIPRLALWSAVFMPGSGDIPRLAAVGHADERRTPGLARWAGAPSGGLAAHVRTAMDGDVHYVTVDGAPTVLVALRARRRALGVLALGRAAGQSFAADEIRLLDDLARRAALALDNARLYGEQVELAEALQAGLLPPRIPEIAGMEIGTAYQAARAGLDVGGDFFDLLTGTDDSWTIIMGDVCGKGAEAATATGVARAVLRVLSTQGLSLSDSLSELNRALRDDANSLSRSSHGRFCTLAAVRLATGGDDAGPGASRALSIALAGHPLPIVLRADGAAMFVGVPGTLLGVLEDDQVAFPETGASLGPGDAIILYTDGVVEARRDGEMLGDDRLLDVVRSCAGMSAQGVADRVRAAAERFSGDHLRDDVAVLVAKLPS